MMARDSGEAAAFGLADDGRQIFLRLFDGVGRFHSKRHTQEQGVVRLAVGSCWWV